MRRRNCSRGKWRPRFFFFFFFRSWLCMFFFSFIIISKSVSPLFYTKIISVCFSIVGWTQLGRFGSTIRQSRSDGSWWFRPCFSRCVAWIIKKIGPNPKKSKTCFFFIFLVRFLSSSNTGHTQHEMTSYCSMKSIFDFFTEKLNSRDVVVESTTPPPPPPPSTSDEL